MTFPRFFIDRPIFAIVLSVLMMIGGIVSFFQLPLSEYPAVTPPTVQVTTAYPGANPDVIAQTVATPLEQAITGVEGMLYMSSQSATDGRMILTITFDQHIDPDMAQIQVQNRVSRVLSRLPDEVQRQGVVTQKTSPDILMVVHLLSPEQRYDPLYISNYAYLQVRDELLRLRRETPAWGSYAHFAHGSASLPPQVLYDALDSWLEAERRWGVQRAAEHFAEPLLAVRDSVARVLGTQPRHIALLDCASRAWSVAFAAALAAHPRIRAISSFDEYGSNSLCLLAARQQRGLELRLIDARGDAAQLLQRLDEQLHDLAPGQTPLLSLSAVPTGHGAATALEGVAERIRAHGGLLFLDASHAVGQLPLAVEAIGCDVLVFPPRKWLRGPKGLGVLYLGERALERLALPDGLDVGGAQWSDAFALQARDDARRFECSEFNPGLRLALKASCDYLLQTDVRRIARRNRQLRERIAQQLYRRLGWTPLEQGPHASALMTYAAPELSGEQWLKRLHARGVNASYIGPQYARWALREQALPGVLRLTPHYLTDDSEIERLGEALEDCLRQRAAS